MLNFKIVPLLNFSDGYFAGEDGYIYSTKQMKILRKLVSSKSNSGTGYYQVSIDGKSRLVHRLVYEAFKGKIEIGKVVSHLDGNKYNNKPENLTSETQKENLSRKLIHGTDDRGFKNSRAKITEEQLKEIKTLLENKNLTHEKIGNKFGVSRVFITKIKNKNRYNN